MSAIFGLIYLDGRPVPQESMDAMCSAMGGWGPDGVEVRVKRCAALGFGRLCTTPESAFEVMPFENQDSGMLITAAARLDNRDELCDLFRVPPAERRVLPDGRLVSLAFHRFGEEAPPRLFGDWSFAVWDEKQRRLFLTRDHLGNTGIFYYHNPPVFAFASSPKAILALPDFQTRLDEWHLARYLTVFPGDEGKWSNTFWQHMRLLLPAHSLTVTPEKLSVRKYWSLDEVSRIRLSSDEEYLEGFLDHFRQAVRVRLRSNRPVGSQLSAGLDSSSVTALAAEALQESGQTLASFTSVPFYPSDHLVRGTLNDEWPLAHTVAEKYDNINHVAVRAEKVSPLDAVHECLDIFGYPIHAAANLYWLQAICSEARRREMGVLLTGQLGNSGISWTGGLNRIYFQLLQGHFAKGLNSLMEYKIRQGVSWYRAFRKHLVRPLIAPLWYGVCTPLLTQKSPPWSGYSAIHQEFARRLGLVKAMREEDHVPFFARPQKPELARERSIQLNGALGYLHDQFGSASRMDVRDPTADVALLTFCFGILGDQYSMDGGERMLIRRATVGVLPEDVRWNTIRGEQAADVDMRMLNHTKAMEEELRMLGASGVVRAYIDVAAMQSAWRSLLGEASSRRNRHATSLLLRGVMAGRFLMKLSNQ